MLSLLVALAVSVSTPASVGVRHSQLVIDGVKQPQLYGAELQYFRLRGGYGRNVPRATVIALWNKALDRMVEAKMNAVSFYIPWDFHEYAEGKFDFTGTADEDGDGRPDYPSRDVITFLRLVAEHGIQTVMVRPGPYINAEWGFLGFGAIPSWFHEKYPDSHMLTPWGWPRPLYDYLNPDFLRHSEIWLRTVYEQVLRPNIGPGRPIKFLQIDNETNYQWQSLASADYGPRATARYQEFLRDQYGDLSRLNRAQGGNWTSWESVTAPASLHQQLQRDRDWYAFNDFTIYRYLGELRKIWERIGAHQPEVLFTLAESYNAAGDGLLPNYVYKNRPDTGLMTVNLYPKTSDTAESPLLNQPFKADLDVKSATEAGNAYFGTANQDWAMGPEIQGGWWRGTNVTDEARQQTYLSVIGHGLKAFFIYYFNEGQNWDIEWAYQKAKPYFERLRVERGVENVPVRELSNEFWGELQARVDRQVVMGLQVRRMMETGGPTNTEDLYFDSPLDPQAEARPHYDLLRRIGERVIAPYGDFLARALEATDDIAIVKDSTGHLPGENGIDSGAANSDWAGGLLGALLNVGFDPRILFGDLSAERKFREAKVLVHIDSGISAPRSLAQLHAALARGQTVVGFLSDAAAIDLKSPVPRGEPVSDPVPLTFYVGSDGTLVDANVRGARAVELPLKGPIFTYDLSRAPGCSAIAFQRGKAVGYRCYLEKGELIQVGAMPFADFNSNEYVHAPAAATAFLRALLRDSQLERNLELSAAEHTVAFARKDPLRKLLWITVKTGADQPQRLKLRVSPRLLTESIRGTGKIAANELLAGKSQVFTRARLAEAGLVVELPAHGSTVFALRNE